MTPLKQTAFRVPDDMLAQLHEIKERDGIPVSEQVRRALKAWIVERDVVAKKPERKRADTRKRP